ncbi:hypothetical protein [Paracoccus zeaxanthinifaciens]|uniref:hypothetical protein n=1 Tax=Paracoccus zeaxanthinifaciens TaxID=187400 RepID=UPI0003B41E6A|nr:hypothetical protein [Paracoccus zeaxanthinifaciens]
MVRHIPLGVALVAAMAPALPASAQDAAAEPQTFTCAGQPAEWLGGTREGSDIATADAAIALTMTTRTGQHPHAAFTVTGDAQQIRLEAASDGDPMLRLQTPDGTQIDENDDAAGTLNSRIETQLAPGDYCVQLIPVGNEDMTAQVQLGTADMEPLLADPEDLAIAACTPQTEATPLAEAPLAAALPARTEAPASVTYHRFTLDQPTGLTLRATSEQLDPNMVLFDGTGRKIAENDDADGLNSRLDFPNGLMAGDYCLGVAPLSAGSGSIAVLAEALDRDTYLAGAYARGEIAPTADGSYPMQALEFPRDRETVVLQDGTAQWLTFTLEEETMVVVNAYGMMTGVDTNLALFGPGGAALEQNDDHGEGTDSQLGPVLLQPGLYRLALTDIGRDEQGAVRPVTLTFDRFLRAE